MKRRPSVKTFRVCFCVLDYYSIELKAHDDDAAIQKAQDLYDRRGEEPFTFDLSQGGTDNWEAEEVLS
jgi:1,2-phenylacetyl-CoA epoxidase PaaB subunit